MKHAIDSTLLAARRRRRLGAGVAGLAIVALLTGSLGWATPGGAQAASEGDFLTSDFGSGNILDGSYCWRGFGFEVAQDTEVSALIGGGDVVTPDAAFLGAIWEGTYDAGTDTLTWGDVVAQVTFPEGENVAVPLASPVTLEAGQVYIIGLGLSITSDEDDSMYEVEDFDSSSITDPGSVISEWIAPSSGEAISFVIGGGGCEGTPDIAVGQSLGVADESTSTIPAIGFTYGAAPEPTTTTTSPAPTTTSPAPTTSTTVAPAPGPVTPKFTG